MAPETSLGGGCLCGSVRYTIANAPRLVSNCHCTLCRKANGAPMVTWVTVRKENFTFISGTPVWYRSSDHGRRGFCANCGSQTVSMHSDYPDYYEVTAGSLDHPERVKPAMHVYAPDRIPWLIMSDGLPSHIGDARSPLIGSE